MARSTAQPTISAIGMRRVVSAGTVWAAIRMSSKPTTESSSGTVQPRLWAACRTPTATRSVDVATAVGGSGSSQQEAQRGVAAGERVRAALEVAVRDAAEALAP